MVTQCTLCTWLFPVISNDKLITVSIFTFGRPNIRNFRQINMVLRFSRNKHAFSKHNVMIGKRAFIFIDVPVVSPRSFKIFSSLFSIFGTCGNITTIMIKDTLGFVRFSVCTFITSIQARSLHVIIQ